MEHLTLADSPLYDWFFFGALALLLLAAVPTLGAKRKTIIRAGFAVAVAAAVTMVGTIGFALNNIEGTRQARAAQVEGAYGLDLTEAKFAELNYPSAAPGEDPELFGSTTVLGDDSAPVTVHLLWDGDQLVLVDGDGTELPRA